MSDMLIDRKCLSLKAAQTMIEAAMSKAADLGVPAVIAVVDDSGNLITMVRMDGAPLLSVELAQDKAYTAIAFGMATHEWFEFIKNDPPLLHGIVKTRRLVVFGGSFPVSLSGRVVGGIGVSGGHYSQDMEIAEAGVEALP